MEVLHAIKLKSRSGLNTIIDKNDLEYLYIGDITECMVFRNKEFGRCKKAGQVLVHLKDSADKLCAGKTSVFQLILEDGRIYGIELLYEDKVEEILVPFKSVNFFSQNVFEKHEFENGLKIEFRRE